MKRKHLPLFLGAILALLHWSGCDVPAITNLDPANASEGMIVKVTATNTLFSTAQFDGTTIPTPWYGGAFFTVPYGSAVGNHDITLTNGHGTSPASVLAVDAAVTIPAPEIKGVQLGYVGFSGATFSGGQLMIYGSNIDCGATIKIGGTAVTTYTQQALINDFCGGVDPQTYGSPNYHYTSLITELTTLTPGATISLTVENLDGTTSAAYSYTLASSSADLDSDGDGLLDDWETNGYDADLDGTIDVDLPAMGCSPYHMDLLVEVDIMNSLSYTPASTMWDMVEATFANAPIMNADYEQGIHIIIDRGQGGAFTGGGVSVTWYEDIDFTQATSAASGAGNNLNFYDCKTSNFDPNRLEIFRYCVWGDTRYNSTSSGKAEDIFSNDFLIGMEGGGAAGNSDHAQAETFVHELGHTLGFGHGGPESDSRVDEPNHLSVMSYCWQFLDIQADCITCTDCYTGNSPSYSEGMAADLDETNLDENKGVCDNVSQDWDGNGIIESGIQANINPDDGGLNNETLDDYDEWHSIKFDFTAAGSGWGSN
ncbi:MAG: hypothetical protein H6581_24925 [Bacteroidia bacterium]|nr:hypothetical protein [Bacteroidia bacterium]